MTGVRDTQGMAHTERRPPLVALCAVLFSLVLRSDSFNRLASCPVLPVAFCFWHLVSCVFEVTSYSFGLTGVLVFTRAAQRKVVNLTALF